MADGELESFNDSHTHAEVLAAFDEAISRLESSDADKTEVTDHKIESSLSHIWHCWINKYQDSRRASGLERARSLYEFKSALDFLRYGHLQLRDAFEGKLATKHQQCSHQLPVPILNNKLKCALGTEVLMCPILAGLKTEFEAQKAYVYPFNGEKAYSHVPDQAIYLLMSRTCAWHLLKEATAMGEGFHIDTSEGYLTDESDRMFWRGNFDINNPCLCNTGSPDNLCPVHGQIYQRRYSKMVKPNESITDEQDFLRTCRVRLQFRILRASSNHGDDSLQPQSQRRMRKMSLTARVEGLWMMRM